MSAKPSIWPSARSPKTPGDAGFRTLLGNSYFAAGRFRSAEQAYKDALSIYPNQPQALLRLALVQIAQGESAEALEFLSAGRDVLDPADLGLAMALAGRASDAVALLDQAARARGADARVRQNLALGLCPVGRLAAGPDRRRRRTCPLPSSTAASSNGWRSPRRPSRPTRSRR